MRYKLGKLGKSQVNLLFSSAICAKNDCKLPASQTDFLHHLQFVIRLMPFFQKALSR